MTWGVLLVLTIYALTRRKFTIYNEGRPYLTRYYFFGKWFRKVFNRNLFLHHFHMSDSREYHGHRWKTGWSLILWGGYKEYRVVGDCSYTARSGKVCPNHMSLKTRQVVVRTFRPLSINKLTSDDFHRTEMLDEKRGCITLFWAGPHKEGGWGFLRDDGTVELASERFKDRRDSLDDD